MHKHNQEMTYLCWNFLSILDHVDKVDQTNDVTFRLREELLKEQELVAQTEPGITFTSLNSLHYISF